MIVNYGRHAAGELSPAGQFASQLLIEAKGLVQQGAHTWPYAQRVAALSQKMWGVPGGTGPMRGAAIREVANLIDPQAAVIARASGLAGYVAFGDPTVDAIANIFNPGTWIDALKGTDAASVAKQAELDKASATQAAIAAKALEDKATSRQKMVKLAIFGGGGVLLLITLVAGGIAIKKKRMSKVAGWRARRRR